MEKKNNFWKDYQGYITKIGTALIGGILIAIVFYFTTKQALGQFAKDIEANKKDICTLYHGQDTINAKIKQINVNSNELNSTKIQVQNVIDAVEETNVNLKQLIRANGKEWIPIEKIKNRNK